MWSTRVRGVLDLREVRDDETGRTLRVATIEGVEGPRRKPLAGPLFDATLVGARSDWWTMTGWERLVVSTTSSPLAFQQSWVLMPVSSAAKEGGAPPPRESAVGAPVPGPQPPHNP